MALEGGLDRHYMYSVDMLSASGVIAMHFAIYTQVFKTTYHAITQTILFQTQQLYNEPNTKHREDFSS